MGIDRIARMQQRMLNVLMEEWRGWLDDLMKGTFDLSKLAELAKATGIDMSQLPGMMAQQPGFDPYQVLGLDKSASDEEVKKRYHDLLHKLHPDTAGIEGTSFLLQMVLAAYEMIKKMRGWQ